MGQECKVPVNVPCLHIVTLITSADHGSAIYFPGSVGWLLSHASSVDSAITTSWQEAW